MKEVKDQQARNFGDLNRALIVAANHLGYPDDLFLGLRLNVRIAGSQGRDGPSHKLLAKVIYRVYDSLKIFEARLSHFKNPITIHELKDGTRAIQFRMIRGLDQTMLRLRDLFHELLQSIIRYDMVVAEDKVMDIEDFLQTQQSILEHNARELRRAA